MKRKVIFLDRDGVINKEREKCYVTTVKEFELLPDVGESLKILQRLGYLLIVITNQSAVNRGLITPGKLDQIHNFMKSQLSFFDVTITDIYYCPHRPDENCECRKPKTKMILQAIEDYDIDVPNSWLIGDKDSDTEVGKILNLNIIKIPTNSSLFPVISEIINHH